MKQTSLFLLFILVSSTPSLALSRLEQIHQTCEAPTGSTPPPAEPAAFLLNELQSKYRRLQDRVNDPNGYLSLMNEALRKTIFASRLKCFEELNAPPHSSAKVVFHDPAASRQMMSFGLSRYEDSSGGRTREYTLTFSLKAPVSMVLFTYLHELTHACQATERFPLIEEVHDRSYDLGDHYDEYSKYTETEYPDSLDPALIEKFKALDRAEAALKQAQFLGEIEAFHVMHEAFFALTPLNPALCVSETESGSDKMYEAYIDVELELQQGIFAQSIIASYLNYHQPKPSFLFETKAEKIEYVFPAREGKKVSLFPLLPSFRAKIEKLGIPVREGLERNL